MLPSYSYSSLDTFRTCPRKFKFQYIQKVPVVKTVAADTYLGNAVHRSLRRLYTLGADGVLCPKDDIIKLYRDEWGKIDRNVYKVISEYYTIDDYIRIGEEMLLRHYDKYQPFNQGMLLGTEMSITFELPGTPFKFRCFIDRLWRRDDGVVEICDYKTGQNIVHFTDPRFRHQMGLYQLAVRSKFPDYDQIDLAQYFLRKDEIVRTRLQPVELDELTEEFRHAILETQNATRMDDFPTQESNFCRYCNFQDICPAKRHRQLLEDEAAGGDVEAFEPKRLKELADRFIMLKGEESETRKQLAALREDIIEASKQTGLTRFDGDLGHLNVKLSRVSKFITKTDDRRAFAELSHLAHQLELDDYFALDGRSLMKEVYSKTRLPEDQLKRLEPFVVEKEDARVTVKLKVSIDRFDE